MTLITFAGLAQQMGMPAYEFFKVTDAIEGCQRIFVRDLDVCMYQRGLTGLADTFDSAAEQLAGLVRGKRVVVAGNSSGAFAALVYGALLNADAVLAWAPLTFLTPERRAQVGDARWPDPVAAAHASPSPVLDLAVFLREQGPLAEAHIWWGTGHPLDHFHIAHVSALPGVCLHPVDYDKHSVVTELRRTGELRRLLAAVLVPQPPDGWCHGPTDPASSRGGALGP